MNWLSLPEVKAHLRVIDDDEDDLITLYATAAELSAQEHLNRRVYASQEALDDAVEAGEAGECPMVVNDLIRAATLLIVGHLYANREDVVVGVGAVEIPNASTALLRPYRRMPGV